MINGKKLWDCTDDEIREAIDDADFNLYGNFKKEEKKKLRPILEGEDIEIKLQTSQWGNRILIITIWNPHITRENIDNEILCRDFELEY